MNFKRVCKDIKEFKIQGALSIAIAGVKAMNLKGFSKKKILSLRATEPALRNGIKFAERFGVEKALEHFETAKKKYVRYGARKIPKRGIVFTHCHSSSVIEILKSAHDKGKKFEVYNTETRPKFQGRKTSKELLDYGINVTEFVDSDAKEALEKSKIMIIGCDAVLSNGDAVNKVGSDMFANIAYDLKVPVYVITDSWKYSARHIKIEQREIKEVWENAPKHLKIKNPAFEIVDSKYIKAIISELGILKPKKFIKKVKRRYKWI